MIQVHGHKPLLLQYGRLLFPVKPDLFSDEKAGRGLQVGLDVCVCFNMDCVQPRSEVGT